MWVNKVNAPRRLLVPNLEKEMTHLKSWYGGRRDGRE